MPDDPSSTSHAPEAGPAEAERTAFDASDARVRAVFEQSPWSTVLYDPSGRPVRANAAFTALWGATVDDVPAGYSAFTDPQLVAAGISDLLRRAFAGESLTAPAIRYDLARSTASGSGRAMWAAAHIYPLREVTANGEPGRVAQVVVQHEDVTARREAELALRASETRLAAVLEALPVGVLIADAEGGLVRDNAAHRTMWGAAPETTDWTTYGEWVGWWPESGRRIAADEWAMARALLHGETVQGELVAYQPFGPVPGAPGVASGDAAAPPRRYFLNNAAPMRDPDGQIVGAVVAEQDVTAQIAAERALREHAERVQLALAAGAILGTWFWDLPTDRFTVDEGFAVNFGIDPAIGRDGLSLAQVTASVHPDDRAGLATAIAEAIARGGAYAHQYRVRRYDGQYYWIEANGRVEHAPDGTPRAFPGVLLDVEERRAVLAAERTARAEAEHARAQLTRVLEAIGEAFVTFDHEWRYTHVNWKAAELLGRPAASLIGRVVWDEFPGAREEPAYAAHLEAVATGRPVTIESYHAPWDRWYENRIHPSPEGASTFFQDITDRKRTQAALAEAARLAEAERERATEANRAKADFLANMSHELRTPLNAIGGYTQLIEMGVHGAVTPAQAEALARVQGAQRHLLALINDVLNFAKLEAGKVEYDVRPVRVGDVVGDVLPLIAPQMAARGHDFAVELADPDAEVWADREKLGQVLLNLLSNAVKFTAPGGRVRIDDPLRADGSSAPEYLHLRVRDTGRGIPREKLERVFAPFVQVETGRTRTTEGTGLGLAISRDLAEGMGGELRARSVEGESAAFTVTLRRVVARDGTAVDRRARLERRAEERRHPGDRRDGNDESVRPAG